MSGLGSLIGSLFLGPVAKAILGKPKRPKPQLQQTTDTGAQDAAARDALSRRRGAAANAILGAKGAESSTGKSSLGK